MGNGDGKENLIIDFAADLAEDRGQLDLANEIRDAAATMPPSQAAEVAAHGLKFLLDKSDREESAEQNTVASDLSPSD